MAYVVPDAATFKVRYPEFAPVPDALVSLVLQEAVDQVGDSWLDRDRARAQMLLAAHYLTTEGEPTRTLTSESSAERGQVKMEKAGDHQREYFGVTASADATDADLTSTEYGRRYLALLRLNFPAIGVV
jgi:hypothetical protein